MISRTRHRTHEGVPVVGDVIAERYRLEDRIEESPVGSTWRATHVGLGRVVAIRLLSDAARHNPKTLERFRKESVLAARLESEHVVRVRDHGENTGVAFLVTEHVEGKTLRTRLAGAGRLGLAETAAIVKQVGRALIAAHAVGLVHRDLKPDNILLEGGGDGPPRVRVVAFGALKAIDEIATIGDGVGLPYYLSPEQARGAVDVGPGADLWSLGVLVFECLTGRRPFEAEALGPLLVAITAGAIPVPSAVAPTLPEPIDAWFATALCRDPRERFGSAGAMSRAFHLASGIGDRASLRQAAELSNEAITIDTKTVPIEDPEHLTPEHVTARRNVPMPSDAAVTVRRASDLWDVDPDMAQLPPELVEERAEELRQRAAKREAPVSMRFGASVASSVPPPSIPPPSRHIPPAMQIPAFPGPISAAPAGLAGPAAAQALPFAGAPGMVSSGHFAEERIPAPPMARSRAGLYIGALVMVLLGGGAAAVVMGDRLRGDDAAVGDDETSASSRRSKRKKTKVADAVPSTEGDESSDGAPTAEPALSAEPESSSQPEPSSAPAEPPPTPREPEPRPQPAKDSAPKSAPVPTPPPAPTAARRPGTHRRTLD